MSEKTAKLREMYKKYNLNTDDAFKHSQGWVILTRSGIEKVQAQENLEVIFTAEKLEPEFAVIKAEITQDGKKVQTFGSAKRGKSGDGNTISWYCAEMAEKRALSRVVLKATQLYKLGVFGIDESEDFSEDKSKRKSLDVLIEDTL